jgi:hypothetical protein
VLVRDEGDHLNVHFRAFPAPMGMALDGDRLAIGTRLQVWEFVNVSAVTAKLEPAARHLNGLGMVEGKPKYVTALGETDTMGVAGEQGQGRHRHRRGRPD